MEESLLDSARKKKIRIDCVLYEHPVCLLENSYEIVLKGHLYAFSTISKQFRITQYRCGCVGGQFDDNLYILYENGLSQNRVQF